MPGLSQPERFQNEEPERPNRCCGGLLGLPCVEPNLDASGCLAEIALLL